VTRDAHGPLDRFFPPEIRTPLTQYGGHACFPEFLDDPRFKVLAGFPEYLEGAGGYDGRGLLGLHAMTGKLDVIARISIEGFMYMSSVS
jgi:hypothetical protein